MYPTYRGIILLLAEETESKDVDTPNHHDGSLIIENEEYDHSMRVDVLKLKYVNHVTYF